MDSFDEMLKKKCETNLSASSFISEDQPTLKENIMDCIVIGEGKVLNLQLLGAIANGNAIIPIRGADGRCTKALKFISSPPFKMKNGRTAHYVTIQILDSGIGQEIKSQKWNRTKTVTKKVEVAKKSLKKVKKLVVDDNVEQRSIFDIGE